MKKSILSLYSLLVFANVHAGVLDNTKVITPEGEKEMRELRVGDEIYCFNPHGADDVATISKIEDIETESLVEITTTDDVTFYAAAEQKLFVSHKWVQAASLTLEDVLLTSQRTFVGIKSIRHINQHAVLRFIQLDKNHTFFAGDNGVLIHNGAVGAVVGSSVGATTVAASYGALTYGVNVGATLIFGGPGGAAVVAAWTLWTLVPATKLTYVGGVFGGIVGGTATGPV